MATSGTLNLLMFKNNLLTYMYKLIENTRTGEAETILQNASQFFTFDMEVLIDDGTFEFILEIHNANNNTYQLQCTIVWTITSPIVWIIWKILYRDSRFVFVNFSFFPFRNL